MNIQPSEIARMDWRQYLTFVLCQVVRELNSQEVQPLTEYEQRVIAQDAMSILTHGPERPNK